MSMPDRNMSTDDRVLHAWGYYYVLLLILTVILFWTGTVGFKVAAGMLFFGAPITYLIASLETGGRKILVDQNPALTNRLEYIVCPKCGEKYDTRYIVKNDKGLFQCDRCDHQAKLPYPWD